MEHEAYKNCVLCQTYDENVNLGVYPEVVQKT